MRTILKSFRIDRQLIRTLEEISRSTGVSQSALVASALENLVEDLGQWEADLALMASDEAYLKEQEELAEELYEDF